MRCATAPRGCARRGEPRSCLDNGDGTIRDKRTALTWEKLSDDGRIHDKDNVYTWAQAFGKIDDLNAASFAGSTDWRLPSYFELLTLVDIGSSYPATPAALDINCGDAATGNPGCTVLTCSCTKASYGGTSSSDVDTPQYKWSVYFGTGSAAANLKTTPFIVRAVRRGS